MAGLFCLLVGGCSLGLWLYDRYTGSDLTSRTLAWMSTYARLTRSPSQLGYILNRTVSNVKELDRAAVLGWEDEFKDDPRYWELVYQLDDIDQHLYSIIGQQGFRFKVSDKSNRDAELLERCDTCEFREATYALLTSRGGVAVTENAGAAEIETSIHRQLAAFDEAIALAPDNSFFYYEKAECLLSIGEWEEAWDYVRRGNVTGLNYKPLPFPQEALIANRDQLRSNNSRISAVLLLSLQGGFRLITHKERAKEVCCLMALGAPLELADDWLTMARRRAQMDNQDAVGQLAAKVNMDILLDFATTECLELSVAQREELDQIKWDLNTACNDVQNIVNTHWPAGNCPFMLTYTAPLSLDPADFELYFKLQPVVEAVNPLLDVLDPPPLAAWGRGELAGVDVDTVQMDIDAGE